MEGDRELCLEAGMDDYIAKPVDREKLLGVFKQLVTRKAFEETGPVDIVKGGISGGGDNNKLPIDMESAMARFDNDTGFFRDMLAEFLNYVPEKLSAIDEAARSGNAADLRNCAHSLKGTCGMLSAGALNSILLKIEEKGYEDNLSDAMPLVEDLKAEVARLEEFSRTLQLRECHEDIDS